MLPQMKKELYTKAKEFQEKFELELLSPSYLKKKIETKATKKVVTPTATISATQSNRRHTNVGRMSVGFSSAASTVKETQRKANHLEISINNVHTPRGQSTSTKNQVTSKLGTGSNNSTLKKPSAQTKTKKEPEKEVAIEQPRFLKKNTQRETHRENGRESQRDRKKDHISPLKDRKEADVKHKEFLKKNATLKYNPSQAVKEAYFITNKP